MRSQHINFEVNFPSELRKTALNPQQSVATVNVKEESRDTRQRPTGNLEKQLITSAESKKTPGRPMKR